MSELIFAYNGNTINIHAQSIIKCKECGEVLATPKGGKLELKQGVHIRRKGE